MTYMAVQRLRNIVFEHTNKLLVTDTDTVTGDM